MAEQCEFSFDSGNPGGDGYAHWLAARHIASRELARRIHLPLNRHVEVWLRGGVRLRGRLRLKEELLLVPEDAQNHLQLAVEGVVFTYRELESCIALD